MVEHHDLEAEREILGAIQLDDTALSMVESLVRAEDFYHPGHAVIFTAAQALSTRGESIHVVTLASELKRKQQLQTIGGASYLTVLTDSAPTIAHIETHAKTVARHAQVRRILSACHAILAKAEEPGLTPEDLASFADKRFADATNGRANNDVVHLSKAIDEVMEQVLTAAETGNKTLGTSTGLADFDALTSGMHPGQLIVVAARPGMGKTSWMMNVIEHVAKDTQKTALVFSLEMTRQDLAARLLCGRSKVDHVKLRKLQFGGNDIKQLVTASQECYGLPIYIHDDGNITLTELRAVCRRVQIKHGLAMVALDYIQLMHAGGRWDSRENEVAEISRSLKSLAKELGVPVLALAQLNRKCEERSDKRPMLSDLRESGAIEQDADVVTFIYRDEVYNKETEDRGVAELIVAKQRSGPTDTVRVAWSGERTQFSNLAEAGRSSHDSGEWPTQSAYGDAE
jgi:replicative DNA helicase